MNTVDDTKYRVIAGVLYVRSDVAKKKVERVVSIYLVLLIAAGLLVLGMAYSVINFCQ